MKYPFLGLKQNTWVTWLYFMYTQTSTTGTPEHSFFLLWTMSSEMLVEHPLLAACLSQMFKEHGEIIHIIRKVLPG